MTAVWWAFMIGFSALCFLLMHLILHGSEEDAPYFVRSIGKYPGIFDQPALNINCVSKCLLCPPGFLLS